MKRIDSHQHFWKYNPAEHTWMTDAMQVLKQDFMPADLGPLLNQIGFDGCIAVQARQLIEETNWLLKLSDENDFIKGVVGWIDLRSPNISEVLSGYVNQKKLVGVRHVVHDEADDNFMLQPTFQNGIAALKEFNLTYDLLLFPKHIPVALQLVEKFPEQPFVLDHIAKPYIKSGDIKDWEQDIRNMASAPNVYCKISGMVTEANWQHWKQDDFTPYLDVVVNAFGIDRIMFGSDWPVCLVAGGYAETINIVKAYFSTFTQSEQDKFFGGNAIQFYNL